MNQFHVAAYNLAFILADEGGTIQAQEMVALFPGQPERHTTASLKTVARWILPATATEEDVDELMESAL